MNKRNFQDSRYSLRFETGFRRSKYKITGFASNVRSLLVGRLNLCQLQAVESVSQVHLWKAADFDFSQLDRGVCSQICNKIEREQILGFFRKKITNIAT